MKAVRKLLLAAGVAAALAVPASATAASPAPAWAIQSLAVPTNFAPGEPDIPAHQPRYQVFITNSGSENAGSSPITVTDTLPAGLGVKKVKLFPLEATVDLSKSCQTIVAGEVEHGELPVHRFRATRTRSGEAFPGSGTGVGNRSHGTAVDAPGPTSQPGGSGGRRGS